MNTKKILVAFFSRTGENYAVGRIEQGNTHIVAEMIASATGGTLFRIEPATPLSRRLSGLYGGRPTGKAVKGPSGTRRRYCGGRV